MAGRLCYARFGVDIPAVRAMANVVMKAAAAVPLAALLASPALSQGKTPDRTRDEVVALMARERAAGHVGVARKTKPIDARPARDGEVVVTVIKGEKETQNRAARGDWVVRNRCPETGNEQYIVRAEKFAARYEKTESTPAGGWQEFRPVGKEMRYYILPRDTEPFTFMAPWNEPMLARPGDAIVQDPQDEKDVYRVEAVAFACTYEIVKGPVPPS
jgi:hypothetical protein